MNFMCTPTAPSVPGTNPIWQKLLSDYASDPAVSQLIFVQCTDGSNADLLMFQKTESHWEPLLSSPAFIGKNGLGKTKEGDYKTPIGVYGLPIVFGIKEDPGARMPYIQVNENLYWCGDDAYYNQLIDITEKPHSCEGEHLIDCAPQCHYAMFIDYNQEGIPGKGSAIFLHCTGKNPYTAGCVAVPEEVMKTIVQKADEGIKICIYQK